MRTLLLNSDYRPLKIISWERAISLFYLDKVDIVKEHPERKIRSASFSINLPTVVRLRSMVRNVFDRSVRFNRNNVYLRDRGCCQYCGRYIPKNKATLDHVIPKSRGGATNWSNVTTCCKNCNNFKMDCLPSEAGMILLVKPYVPSGHEILINLIKSDGDSKLIEQWSEFNL